MREASTSSNNLENAVRFWKEHGSIFTTSANPPSRGIDQHFRIIIKSKINLSIVPVRYRVKIAQWS